ncbi:MAG: PP2C family protein-serine/threonine phosphatase [Holophaga sp.]
MSPSLRAIRWRLIFTSVLALFLALGSFYLNQWAYAASEDQCVWRAQDRRVVLQELLPGGVAEGAGLLEGDELLLVHGRKVTPQDLDQAVRFISRQPKGRVLIYTVRREGRILRLPVRLVQPFNATSLIVLITGLVAWATGLLVAISSPSRKSARHLYYMGLAGLLAGLWFPLGTAAWPGSLLLLSSGFAALGLGLGPPLWVHFFLRFPHPYALRTDRRFLRILYGACLAGAFLAVGDRLLRAWGWADRAWWLLRVLESPPAAAVASGFVPLAVLAGLALFWAGARRQRPRKRRALLPVLLLTTVVAADLLAYRFLLLRGAGPSLQFARDSWIYYAPLPLLPLSFAIAIFRHGFFDVRRAILRWVSYFIVLGLILAVYLGGIAFLFAEGIQAVPPGWAGALVGLAALPIGWLLRALLQALRRKFRRDLTTARETLLGGLRETRKRFSVEDILDGLAESLRTAYQPHLLLLLPGSEGGFQLPPAPVRDSEPPGGPVPADPPRLRLPKALLRHAREDRELVLGLQSDEAEWIREQGPALRAHLDALEAQVLALILVNDEPYAALVLGGKYSELNYGREDRELLREVAIATGLLLETALAHSRLLDQGRIEQELHTARLIQQSLVTSQAPELPGFQAALRLVPALETGGDLLWVGRRPSGRHLAAVGDVSGKGLPAALYMAQATALLTFAAQQEDLAFDQILPSLDRVMGNLLGPKDFLTLAVLEWEPSGRFQAARAGHPPVLLVTGPAREDVAEIASRGRGLGLRPALQGNWQVVEGHLLPGQWLVMYSDGLTEAMNKDGELYGLPRLITQVQGLWPTGSARAACEAIFRDVADYEAQNRDDRTLFILSRDSA